MTPPCPEIGPQRSDLPVSDVRTHRHGNDIGNSNYNGVVWIRPSTSRRMAISCKLLTRYSHSIDDNSAFFGSLAVVVSPNGDSSTWNVAIRLSTRGITPYGFDIDVPVGPGHRCMGSNNMFNREVFGGWPATGIITAQTGQPFTVYDSAQRFQRVQPIRGPPGFHRSPARSRPITAIPMPRSNRGRWTGIFFCGSPHRPCRHSGPKRLLRSGD